MELSLGPGSKFEKEAEQNSGPVPGPMIVPASARGWGGQSLCGMALHMFTALSAALAWSPEPWAR